MTEANDMLSKVRVDSIINGSPTAIAILDRNLRIVAMNDAMELMTGFPIEKARGIPCTFIIRNNLCPKGCPAKKALADSRKAQATGNIINRDRETVPVRITASPLIDEDGNTVGVMEALEDISVPAELLESAPHLEQMGELVGVSDAMNRIKSALPVFAATDSSVLITGETGSGKDLVASIIHRLSPRAQGPFIKVNCGALPDTLLESELFGHVRGAFTGADRDKPGRFQLADGGTVYLTEIGDLHLPLQVKLLSFLDDKEVTPLGGTKSIKTDVRIIAATHRDLPAMVGEGTFREDLLYRLNVVRIDIPPVRDREGDVVLLLEHFLKVFREKLGKEVAGFGKDALALLKKYAFPGNVREIRNVVEYAANVCPGGEVKLSHLPDYMIEMKEGGPSSAQVARKMPVDAPPDSLPMRAAREGMDWEKMERVMINDALIKARGNRAKAAEILGWARSTLWRKMKKHGISVP